MPIEVAFTIGVSLLLFLTLKVKVNPFISLLSCALAIGLLSGMEPTQVIQTMIKGFGSVTAKIGIVIIFGVILGKCLEQSGAAEKIARSLIRAIGEKQSPLAMAVSGYLISIPVFSDVGYVMLAPLAKAISAQSRISFPLLAVPLAAGLLATHVLVPPTPGPLAIAGLLEISIAQMVLWGGLTAMLMTLAGWGFAQFILPRYQEKIIPQTVKTEMEAKQLPSLRASLFPLVLPLLLILSNTTALMSFPQGDPVRNLATFFGNANIAMSIGAILALTSLRPRLGGKNQAFQLIDESLIAAGPIIFITAAGGALGAILKSSGAGETLAQTIAASGLPFIVVPFIIAGILKTIQGSGTVAVITAATLCLPLANQLGLPPILIALAAGSGARLVCHVNDSFFWVYTNISGFDPQIGIKTLTFANVFMAFAGLLGTWIVSLLL